MFGRKKFESKETAKHGVLKSSEMALYYTDPVKGVMKIGEIGNPSYRDKDDYFVYDPELGLNVQGNKGDIEIPKDDMIKLPHDVGHVSIEDYFGSNEIVEWSGKDFMKREFEYNQMIQLQLRALYRIADVLGVEMEDSTLEVDDAIKRAAADNEFWSPQDVVHALFEKIQPQLPQEYQDLDERLSQIGVLTDNPKDSQKGVVGLFYLYSSAAGVNFDDHAALKESVETFPFYDELEHEYKTAPDGRFGDDLLVLMSELEHEDQE